MTTNGDWLVRECDQLNIPPQTLDQVKATIAEAKRTNADLPMARMMVRYGNVTPDAREWARRYVECAS